jgi:hypothetical protein
MEMLRDSYSPLCCWVGDAVVEEILKASTVEELEKAGVLKQIEQQMYGKGRTS